ncbi:hypothetical protein ASG89_06230 [Paenibacillus sp. Soil766]|uniref:copper amine oxidase N-terminal domain-containing protein n=1 Tax=Paenibacillus sp. Soil766 TaxID=1736404 RepID=UPI00070FFBF8|nr:copper amine oxidase N-terminal domain-containing protein [Paenibacillus sp. Soil766]KRE93102.1 hypothetical protein ASG89_06230 [Paenibacillus sp. Soil766]
MRWIPLLTFLSILILLGADSSSEIQDQEIELLEFHSQIAPNAEPISAILYGADRFDIPWRLHDAAPQKLFVTNDGTAYYQSNNQWKSILPNGERVPVKPNHKLPDPVTTQIPPNLKVTANSLSLFKDQKSIWAYTLPASTEIRPSTLQIDAAEHIYFHDNSGSWYSLDQDGNLRYKLKLQTDAPQFACMVTYAGDAFCTSPHIGIIGIHNKTNAPRLIIDGKERFFTQEPQIIDGFTFVPLRSIFEALQSQVDWNAETQTVTATKGKQTVKLTLHSETAQLNGKNIQLDASPILYQESTFVPLRFVGEALGASVIWEDVTRTIQIISKQ